MCYLPKITWSTKAGISDEDRTVFYRSLNIISENIEKVAKSYDK